MSNVRRGGFAGIDSVSLALIPLAIAINIVIGNFVTGTPVYLDSIGTVLVGALLGPWLGLLTGVLSNLIWWLLGNPIAAWFAYVAGAIGLLAGLAGRQGAFFRSSPRWLAALIGGVFFFALTLFIFTLLGRTFDESRNAVLPSATTLLATNWPVFALTTVIGLAVGYYLLNNGGYAGLAGLLTGLVAAVISAPMAAYVFGGVTGAGTDLLVAAFRASGAGILQSTLAQGSVSDPFDKMTSFLLVWLIVQSLPRRLLLRFPNTRAGVTRAGGQGEIATGGQLRP